MMFVPHWRHAYALLSGIYFLYVDGVRTSLETHVCTVMGIALLLICRWCLYLTGDTRIHCDGDSFTLLRCTDEWQCPHTQWFRYPSGFRNNREVEIGREHTWIIAGSVLESANNWRGPTEIFTVEDRDDPNRLQSHIAVRSNSGRTECFKQRQGVGIWGGETPWPLVRKLTILTERPPLVDEI
jgi:hypothetical protein